MSDETGGAAEPKAAMRDVRIEIKSYVDAVVKVGGVNVAGMLTGFDLSHHVGEMPRLILEIAPRAVHLGSAVQLAVLKSIPEILEKPVPPSDRIIREGEQPPELRQGGGR